MEEDNNFSIDNLISEIDFDKNKLQKVNSDLTLTEYQIYILKKCKIPIESVKSLSELIYMIDNTLSEVEDEELEIVLGEIAERNYYQNTNK